MPLLAFACLRLPIAWATWFGLIVGGAGLVVLGLDPSQGWTLGRGEGLTFLSSIIFAVFILLLDRLGRSVRSSQLALGLIALGGLPAVPLAVGVTAAGPGVDVWLRWVIEMLRDPWVLKDIVLMTILSTVIATILMSTFQPRVSASRAALIYLFEPVFAATLSVLLRHDVVTVRLIAGCGLILGANALVELPLWLRGFASRRRSA